MTRRILVCAVMVTSSLVACSSDDSEPGAPTPCAALCAKQSEPMCPNDLPRDTCISACQSDADRAAATYPQCKSQWDKYDACLSTTPYVCDDLGIPRVQGCDTEKGAYVACRDADGGATD
jgi:hypothetical protein